MSAIPGPLREYDRGPGAFAALVGGALSGVQAGYGFRQQIQNDREARADRERKRLEDAIRLRIDIENAGYNPDDLEGGKLAPDRGGEPWSERPSAPAHPGHAPMDEDPRDFGFGGVDPGAMQGQAPQRAAPPADPFRIETPQSRATDPIRSRVADILFQGVPKMRRGESAQERAARVQDERISARERTQDAAVIERERYQQSAMDARAEADRAERERQSAANNRTALGVARINAGSREQVAAMRPARSGDPSVRYADGLVRAQKGVVEGLDRAIRLAESRIPKEIPLSMSEAQFQQQYGPQLAAVQELHARRDREDAKRVAMIDKMLQGDLDFSDLVPGAVAPPPQPHLDIRGRWMGGSPTPPAANDTGDIDLGRQGPPVGSVQPSTPGRARPLTPTEAARAASDPDFARWLEQRGYGPQDWQAAPNVSADHELVMRDQAIAVIQSLGLAPAETQRRVAEVTRRWRERTGQR